MIIDGSHKQWCIATLLLFLLSTGTYVVYAHRAQDGPRGGSVPGMLFGIAGSGLMLYAGLISARKKVPAWRIGTAQTWLRGHIWLGLLSVPLILFHAGFRWGGLLEQVLMAVFAAIILSGLVGLAIQQFLPGEMTARVPRETFYAQIPYECRLLQVEGDVAVAAVCGPLPLSPDEEVATQPRLKSLGVAEKKDAEKKAKDKDKEKSAAEKEREKLDRLLSSVYRLTDGDEQKAVPDEIAPQPAVDSMPAAQAESNAVAGHPKPLSAADKIAMMRAGKTGPTTKVAEVTEPKSKVSEQPPTTDQPKPKLSAAEKIAMMRAAKPASTTKVAEITEPTPQTKDEPSAADVAQPKLGAAEKIALMRKGKQPATAKETNTAPIAEDHSDPAKAKPALSAADKIAMMRAAKAKASDPAPPVSTTEGAPAPVAAPAVARTEKKTPPAASLEKPLNTSARQQGVEELMKFYLESVRPFLHYGSRNGVALSGDLEAGGVFAVVRSGLSDDLRPALARLEELCEARRQLIVQQRIHHWLHGWLFIHVPLSVALLGLGVVHVVMSLYY